MGDDIKGFTVEEDDGWGGYCTTARCGGGGPGFSTRQWPSDETASARLQQHLNEHATGEPMQVLSKFRRDHDLEVDKNGTAVEVPEGANEVVLEGSDE